MFLYCFVVEATVRRLARAIQTIGEMHYKLGFYSWLAPKKNSNLSSDGNSVDGVSVFLMLSLRENGAQKR